MNHEGICRSQDRPLINILHCLLLLTDLLSAYLLLSLPAKVSQSLPDGWKDTAASARGGVAEARLVSDRSGQ